ncbi:PepSY-associated TM helix domain-containing protein [Thalassotalea euphylliae]|uniref:PepSY domain-containing protein n=1 Tax=Thalassotalea euphylliae TaxID=1655234 RepID=A0A3E0UGG4_9GAMM|nr:PepSY-associated TM helix domain-containing protein [Thalassotalea euphylliae]REL35255.1 PepSY domain-containing protein [Thalassotalea euphylliae]
MKSKSIKKLYTLHSWVGIITGILLFVIAFTGAVSVFGRPEIKIWANPEIRTLAQVDTAKVEQLVAEYATQVPEHYQEEILIFLPRVRGNKHLAIIFESHHGEPVTSDDASIDDVKSEQAAQKHSPPVGTSFEFDPHSYELVREKSGLMSEIFATYESDMADFIVDFHADLHLGRPIGLLTTGVLGLTMMLSIVTGIFIHRKILGQLFTFRPRKSYSLMLNDGHKAIGVWGLLFNAVIAFTGAFLGLAVVVLVPAAAFVSFGGDQDKLVETFTAIPAPVIQNVQQSTAIGSAFDHAFELHDEVIVRSMTVMGYGDASAKMYVGIAGGQNIAAQTAVYQAGGEFVERYSNFGRIEGVTGKILDIMYPLHFGNFGGILVKAIWVVLGLGTALLPLTGLMLWMERGVNAANPRYSMKTYQRFNRLIVGSCGGLVVATMLLFPTQMMIKYGMGNNDVGSIIGWPFFISWLAIIVAAFLVPYEKHFARQLAYVTAALLIAVLPIDLLVTGTNKATELATGHYLSSGIDLVCLALGLYLFKLMKNFPKPLPSANATVINQIVANQASANQTGAKEAV